MRNLFAIVVLGLLSPASAQESAGPFAAFDLAGPPVLNDPHDLTMGPDGRLYVADKYGSRIAVLDPETLEIVEIIGAGALPQVRDVSFGPDGRAAVAVTGIGAVIVFDALVTAGPSPTPSEALTATNTEGALMHSSGTVYAMESATGLVLAYKDGAVVATTGGHSGAHDIAEDLDGNIWVADNTSRRLVKYSPDLALLQVLDDPKFGFLGPRYLDVDEFGRLIVADQDAHRVLMIDPDGPDGGSLIGVIGNGIPGEGPGRFDDPEGVAVHDGRYFISDSDNNRVVRYIVVLN